MTTWAIRHAEGSVIGTGDSKELNADSLSDEELQGTLDTHDFSANRSE